MKNSKKIKIKFQKKLIKFGKNLKNNFDNS